MRERHLGRILAACEHMLRATDLFSAVVGRASKADVQVAREQVERLCRGRKKSARAKLMRDVQQVLGRLPDKVGPGRLSKHVCTAHCAWWHACALAESTWDRQHDVPREVVPRGAPKCDEGDI